MRNAAQVGAAYVIILVLGAIWRLFPFQSMPDIVALVAAYLGLTARDRLAPAMFAAVILGYLADLLGGTPKGLMALTAAVVCVVGHVVHARILVRGLSATLTFAFFTGLAAGVFVMIVRAFYGFMPAGLWADVGVLLGSAILTGLVGPLVFRICRSLDARFARTFRERDVALDGLIP